MTYFSDYEKTYEYYDNPQIRNKILSEAEEEFYDDCQENDLPWDVLNEY